MGSTLSTVSGTYKAHNFRKISTLNIQTPRMASLRPKGPLCSFTPALLPSAKILSGRTITLEKLEPKHADDLFNVTGGNDPSREALWDYMFEEPFSDFYTFKESIASKSASSDPFFYAIIDQRKTLPTFGKAVGYIALMRLVPNHLGVEIGHVMFSSALQRTTGATEAIYLLVQHSFHDLGYRRLEWKCNSLNEPSRRAALRLGFTFEGIFRQHMIVKGRSRDTAWFSILKDEWDASLKSSMEKWLSADNFKEDGSQVKSLQDLRTGQGS
jgi:RimJ/RimL family protein N-acetyltransferase